MEPSLSDQIRAAQAKVANPVEAANFRDALTLRIVEATIVDAAGRAGYAASVFRVVDALMAERAERVTATLAEIEVWGTKRARSEGIVMTGGPETLAAALLRRFGGDAEIPTAELDDVVTTTKTIRADSDEERGTVRFTLVPEPKRED